jgi:hypothetical protein
MEPIFPAAIEHIRRMESRISNQKFAIERLRLEGRDTSDAMRRLKLLHAALAEMRSQLAQLTPTHEQVSAPFWALPLIGPSEVEDTAQDATT